METNKINSEKMMSTNSETNNSRRKTMRRYIYLFAMLTLFVTGCNEDSNMILSANNLNASELNWIALPQALGMNSETTFMSSKIIDGPKGGSIAVSNTYIGGTFGTVTLNSNLQFPKGSHCGKVTFTVAHDDAVCVSTFAPTYVFNKALTFNITYTGVNLSGVNPSTVKFAYIANDGTVQYAQHEGITVNVAIGKISVKNAKIPHFSRYGFVN